MPRRERDLDEEGEDAVEMYRRFWRMEPRKLGDFAKGFAIPKTVREIGPALFVTYRSGKVDPSTLRKPRKPVDYIHEHDAGVKLYLPGNDHQFKVPDWLAYAQALSLLGLCTGIGYKVGGEKSESESTRPYPELYTTANGKALIVVQGKSKVVAMMWGGGLGVEGRGIVG